MNSIGANSDRNSSTSFAESLSAVSPRQGGQDGGQNGGQNGGSNGGQNGGSNVGGGQNGTGANVTVSRTRR